MQKAFSRPWGKNIVTCGNAGRQNSRQSAKFPDRPAQGMVVPAGSRGRDEDRVSASCRNVFFLWGNWRRRRDSNPRYRFRYTPLAGERLRPLGHLSARGFTMRQSLRLQGFFESRREIRRSLLLPRDGVPPFAEFSAAACAKPAGTEGRQAAGRFGPRCGAPPIFLESASKSPPAADLFNSRSACRR